MLARHQSQRLLRIAALCTLTLATPAAAQQMQDVEIQVIAVAPGVHMLVGRGGNIGVSSGEDGVFLVDDQYAPLTAKITAAIRTFSVGPIRFVLNTHWHGDHTGGNENLGRGGTLIVAHENVRKRMSVDQFLQRFGPTDTVPASPEAALPAVTFTDAVTFHLNGDEIRAFHIAPAHTDGDAVIVFRNANVAHMGDAYFNGIYPFIDVASGGSVDGMIAAADRVLALIDDDAKVIPGHGPLSNKAELLAFRDMLATIRFRVQRGISEGQSVDAIVAAKPSSAFDAEWGDGFITPESLVRTVYRSLTAQKAMN